MEYLSSFIGCAVCIRLKFDNVQVAPLPLPVEESRIPQIKHNDIAVNTPKIIIEAMPALNDNNLIEEGVKENSQSNEAVDRQSEEVVVAQPEPEIKGCCRPKTTGILYATPSDACRGVREKVLFVTCPSISEPRRPDALMTVDVNPQSKTYCQILCKLEFPNIGDEIHHTGWNACASCYGKTNIKRTNLIIPCLHSSRVYVVNTEVPHKLKLTHTVEADEFKPLNVSFLHTTHCLADGNIMISTLGDNEGKNSGEFVLLDAKDFRVKGKWNKESQKRDFNYDYWYQPRKNVMISTEWGTPRSIKSGFNLDHVSQGHYGNKIHIWNWTTHELKQTIELEGPLGLMPLEVRFYHEPSKAHAFIGTALGSAVYHIYQENDDQPYKPRVAAIVQSHKVEGWVLPNMPALVTDIIISMDDQFLYISCWLHGEIRMYNIKNPFDVKLVGIVTIGGLLHNQSGIKVLDNDFKRFDQTVVKGRTIYGGPQMLQLSLDGRRLYVTTSLYTVWDKQFYPDLQKKGSVMLKVDIDINNQSLSLDKDFLIDFAELEGGPYAAHEMRYPGGDCTSDIWL